MMTRRNTVLPSKRFEVAAKIPTTSPEALYNWGNALFDLSLAARNGASEVMTRSAEKLLQRALAKYRQAIAKDPSFADARNNLANALSDLARAEDPRHDNGRLREAFRHYEKAIKTTQTPDVVHCNYAKALHDLARITKDRRLYKRSLAHFDIAARCNPDYYSVFLSWGHALSDLARITESAQNYTRAIDKYRRAAKIKPTDTAALHSWYYTLLEFADRSTRSKKEGLLKQAKAVSREQKRRRRVL
jgi:tetratricopeptide (TPR) repeat protein